MAQAPTADLTDLRPILDARGGEGRPALLPVLLDAQRAFGFLSPPVVEAIGQELRVPPAGIHGVIAFFTMLSPRPAGGAPRGAAAGGAGRPAGIGPPAAAPLGKIGGPPRGLSSRCGEIDPVD